MPTAVTHMIAVLGAAVALGGCLAGTVLASDPNALTDQEKRAGFELLFNGRDLRGWKPALHSWNVENGFWKVENGAIYMPRHEDWPPLVYHRKAIPADFDLRFQWKESPLSEAIGTGQFALGTSGEMTREGWTGRLFCDYLAGERPIRLLTDEISVAVKFAGISMSKAAIKDARRPAGQWNEARMACKGPLIQHWLNGEKILEVDLRDGNWLKLDQNPGKPLLNKWFNVKTHGFTLEIGHTGVTAWYRGFKVRAIGKDEEIGDGGGDTEMASGVRE